MAAASNQKSRKVKALLAGGLVLSVGAAVTLAAWTDQEWATGNFTAGSFNIQGTTDPALAEDNWSDHATEGTAAALTFEVNAANLMPSSVVAEGFALRTASGTTYNAATNLMAATSTGGNAANLSYEIFTVDSMTACTPTAVAATGSEIVAGGTDFGPDAPSASEFTLQSVADAAGTPTILCFQVTAKDTLEQAQTATATWQFEATSVE